MDSGAAEDGDKTKYNDAAAGIQTPEENGKREVTANRTMSWVDPSLEHRLHPCSELRIAPAFAVEKGRAVRPGCPEQRRREKVVLGIGVGWHQARLAVLAH